MRAVLVLLITSATTARADTRVATAEPPGRTPTEAELRAAEPPPEPPPTLERFADYDAAYDRAYLTSSALTLAPGHVEASARSALDHAGIASVAAGLARGFELSVNAAKVGSVGKGLGVGLKVALVRHATWSAAATASVEGEWQASSGLTSKIYSAGARATTCLGSTCSTLFTFGGGIAVSNDGYSSDVTPSIDTSLVIGKGFVRPLLEMLVVGGELGFAGARFGGSHITFDAGLGGAWGALSYTFGDKLMAMVGLSVRP